MCRALQEPVKSCTRNDRDVWGSESVNRRTTSGLDFDTIREPKPEKIFPMALGN